jgi:hypothetical protein
MSPPIMPFLTSSQRAAAGQGRARQLGRQAVRIHLRGDQRRLARERVDMSGNVGIAVAVGIAILASIDQFALAGEHGAVDLANDG